MPNSRWPTRSPDPLRLMKVAGEEIRENRLLIRDRWQVNRGLIAIWAIAALLHDNH